MSVHFLASANPAWPPLSLNLCILLFLSLPQSGLPKYSQRTVKTAYGELRGVIYPKGGNLLKDVEAFLGVPYASAPAAGLRFMPPLTPTRWTGVRIADKLGPVCPQILPDITNRSEALSKMPLLKFTRVLDQAKILTNQSEDCLFLNIFLPLRDGRGPGGRYSSSGGGENLGGGGGYNNNESPGGGGRLAIVVILQGESWEWGSGNLIDGSALAAYGHVMVITLNYRLNVLEAELVYCGMASVGVNTNDDDSGDFRQGNANTSIKTGNMQSNASRLSLSEVARQSQALIDRPWELLDIGETRLRDGKPGFKSGKGGQSQANMRQNHGGPGGNGINGMSVGESALSEVARQSQALLDRPWGLLDIGETRDGNGKTSYAAGQSASKSNMMQNNTGVNGSKTGMNGIGGCKTGINGNNSSGGYNSDGLTEIARQSQALLDRPWGLLDIGETRDGKTSYNAGPMQSQSNLKQNNNAINGSKTGVSGSNSGMNGINGSRTGMNGMNSSGGGNSNALTDIARQSQALIDRPWELLDVGEFRIRDGKTGYAAGQSASKSNMMQNNTGVNGSKTGMNGIGGSRTGMNGINSSGGYNSDGLTEIARQSQALLDRPWDLLDIGETREGKPGHQNKAGQMQSKNNMRHHNSGISGSKMGINGSKIGMNGTNSSGAGSSDAYDAGGLSDIARQSQALIDRPWELLDVGEFRIRDGKTGNNAGQMQSQSNVNGNNAGARGNNIGINGMDNGNASGLSGGSAGQCSCQCTRQNNTRNGNNIEMSGSKAVINGNNAGNNSSGGGNSNAYNSGELSDIARQSQALLDRPWGLLDIGEVRLKDGTAVSFKPGQSSQSQSNMQQQNNARINGGSAGINGSKVGLSSINGSKTATNVNNSSNAGNSIGNNSGGLTDIARQSQALIDRPWELLDVGEFRIRDGKTGYAAGQSQSKSNMIKNNAGGGSNEYNNGNSDAYSAGGLAEGQLRDGRGGNQGGQCNCQCMRQNKTGNGNNMGMGGSNTGMNGINGSRTGMNGNNSSGGGNSDSYNSSELSDIARQSQALIDRPWELLDVGEVRLRDGTIVSFRPGQSGQSQTNTQQQNNAGVSASKAGINATGLNTTTASKTGMNGNYSSNAGNSLLASNAGELTDIARQSQALIDRPWELLDVGEYRIRNGNTGNKAGQMQSKSNISGNNSGGGSNSGNSGNTDAYSVNKLTESQSRQFKEEIACHCQCSKQNKTGKGNNMGNNGNNGGISGSKTGNNSSGGGNSDGNNSGRLTDIARESQALLDRPWGLLDIGETRDGKTSYNAGSTQGQSNLRENNNAINGSKTGVSGSNTGMNGINGSRTGMNAMNSSGGGNSNALTDIARESQALIDRPWELLDVGEYRIRNGNTGNKAGQMQSKSNISGNNSGGGSNGSNSGNSGNTDAYSVNKLTESQSRQFKEEIACHCQCSKQNKTGNGNNMGNNGNNGGISGSKTGMNGMNSSGGYNSDGLTEIARESQALLDRPWGLLDIGETRDGKTSYNAGPKQSQSNLRQNNNAINGSKTGVSGSNTRMNGINGNNTKMNGINSSGPGTSESLNAGGLTDIARQSQALIDRPWELLDVGEYRIRDGKTGYAAGQSKSNMMQNNASINGSKTGMNGNNSSEPGYSGLLDVDGKEVTRDGQTRQMQGQCNCQCRLQNNNGNNVGKANTAGINGSKTGMNGMNSSGGYNSDGLTEIARESQALLDRPWGLLDIGETRDGKTSYNAGQSQSKSNIGQQNNAGVSGSNTGMNVINASKTGMNGVTGSKTGMNGNSSSGAGNADTLTNIARESQALIDRPWGLLDIGETRDGDRKTDYPAGQSQSKSNNMMQNNSGVSGSKTGVNESSKMIGTTESKTGMNGINSSGGGYSDGLTDIARQSQALIDRPWELLDVGEYRIRDGKTGYAASESKSNMVQNNAGIGGSKTGMNGNNSTGASNSDGQNGQAQGQCMCQCRLQNNSGNGNNSGSNGNNTGRNGISGSKTGMNGINSSGGYNSDGLTEIARESQALLDRPWGLLDIGETRDGKTSYNAGPTQSQSNLRQNNNAINGSKTGVSGSNTGMNGINGSRTGMNGMNSSRAGNSDALTDIARQSQALIDRPWELLDVGEFRIRDGKTGYAAGQSKSNMMQNNASVNGSKTGMNGNNSSEAGNSGGLLDVDGAEVMRDGQTGQMQGQCTCQCTRQNNTGTNGINGSRTGMNGINSSGGYNSDGLTEIARESQALLDRPWGLLDIGETREGKTSYNAGQSQSKSNMGQQNNAGVSGSNTGMNRVTGSKTGMSGVSGSKAGMNGNSSSGAGNSDALTNIARESQALIDRPWGLLDIGETRDGNGKSGYAAGTSSSKSNMTQDNAGISGSKTGMNGIGESRTGMNGINSSGGGNSNALTEIARESQALLDRPWGLLDIGETRDGKTSYNAGPMQSQSNLRQNNNAINGSKTGVSGSNTGMNGINGSRTGVNGMNSSRAGNSDALTDIARQSQALIDRPWGLLDIGEVRLTDGKMGYTAGQSQSKSDMMQNNASVNGSKTGMNGNNSSGSGNSDANNAGVLLDVDGKEVRNAKTGQIQGQCQCQCRLGSNTGSGNNSGQTQNNSNMQQNKTSGAHKDPSNTQQSSAGNNSNGPSVIAHQSQTNQNHPGKSDAGEVPLENAKSVHNAEKIQSTLNMQPSETKSYTAVNSEVHKDPSKTQQSSTGNNSSNSGGSAANKDPSSHNVPGNSPASGGSSSPSKNSSPDAGSNSSSSSPSKDSPHSGGNNSSSSGGNSSPSKDSSHSGAGSNSSSSSPSKDSPHSAGNNSSGGGSSSPSKDSSHSAGSNSPSSGGNSGSSKDSPHKAENNSPSKGGSDVSKVPSHTQHNNNAGGNSSAAKAHKAPSHTQQNNNAGNIPLSAKSSGTNKDSSSPHQDHPVKVGASAVSLGDAKHGNIADISQSGSNDSPASTTNDGASVSNTESSGGCREDNFNWGFKSFMEWITESMAPDCFLQTTSQQGNYALMDIVAALSWIRENAGVFGADINRITILGHRTGAVIANFLMLAPVASELFHRVILLSGSALSPWSFQRHSKSNVRKLADHLKCLRDKPTFGLFSPPLGPPRAGVSALNPSLGASSLNLGGNNPMNLKVGQGSSSDTFPDVGPCLRQSSREELLSSVNNLLVTPRFLARFGPLIDSSVVKSDFVSEMKIDASGRFSKFPLLIGTASVESFGELNTEDIEDGLSEPKRDRILRTFVRNVFVFHLNEIYSTIKNEYTDWEKPRKDFIDVRDSILNILSDGLTVAPLIQVASMHSAKANAKTFFFHFQYEPDHSVYPNRIGSISDDLMEFAAGHALLDQTFNVERSLPSYTANDAKVSKSLMHYLTNFIISGDPNSGYDGSSVEDAQLPFWDSYDPINQFYLEIGGGEPRMKSHYRGHKMALWLNLIPQLHQSGGSDVAMLHHNFRDERPEFYEGVVREQAKHPSTADDPLTYTSAGSVGNKGVGGGGNSRESGNKAPASDPDEELEGPEDYENELGGDRARGKGLNSMFPTLAPAVMSTSECPPNTTNATGMDGGPSVAGPSMDRDLVRQLAAAHYHSYGTALGVTIGVGCCLLLLNLLIFLAIYHQKTHNVPSNTEMKDHSPEDEENPMPLPSSLTRPRSHPDLRHGCRIGSQGASTSVPALYNDDENDGTDEYDDDIVQELRECTGHGHSHAGSHASFRMNPNKELSSSSGFSSPSIPDPPPPPRVSNTFASLTRGSVRVLKRDDSRDFGENGTC